MTEEANVFKFDLSEFLSFQKGQEVLELIGIALEPDISIYESEDNVTIRGVIELTGEYIPNERNSADELDTSSHVYPFQNQQLKNYIQDIRMFEDGLNEFRYHIPVDVTIPKYRVPSLDDVMVEIDYFDYQIPDPSQLKVQAEIIISGIEQEAYESTEALQVDRELEYEKEEVNQPFSFDVTFDKEEESTSFVQEEGHDDSDQEAEQPDRIWFKEKTETFDEFFNKSKEEVVDEESSSSSSSSDSVEKSYFEVSPDDLSPDSREDENQEVHVVEEQMEEEEEKIQEEVKRKEPEYTIEASERNEKEEVGDETFYLVNMFREEEYSFSRIRMCIMQEEDTIDSIAERYDLPKTQIIRYNNIEEEDVKPGDILYIPRKFNKNPS